MSFVDATSISAQETNPNDIAFSADGTKMFVTGHTGDDVNVYSLSAAWDASTRTFIGSIFIGVHETVPTGVAFNVDGTKMYVIGSIGDDIDEYSISSVRDFVESASGDGSVDGSLTVTLLGDTFQDEDDDDVLDVGDEVALSNVPAGLTTSIALSQGDTVATLTFSGTANSHANDDDVDDILFVFDDSAFTSTSAEDVANATGPASSGAGINFEGAFLTYIPPGGFDASARIYVDR